MQYCISKTKEMKKQYLHIEEQYMTPIILSGDRNHVFWPGSK